MKVAAEHVFTGTTQAISSYDSTKTLLGTLLNQYTGATSLDKYVSTVPWTMVNQVEAAGGSYFMPHVYQWSSNIFWVFVASNATAAATRAIGLYEFNSTTGQLTWKGFVTLSGTTITGNKTVRALRGFVTKHTTGTVSTSGSSTTINGSGTKFTDDRIAVGARIGFGTTDPTQVTSWYDISAISNNTTLTIGAAVNLSAGTSYVIEEIRILVATTNATLTNGGVHLIKGLNYSTFSIGGTTIPEASTVDNIRASYLLKDAATTTMTVLAGVASNDPISATEHYVYALNLDSATLLRIFKLNVRAALTVSGGTSTDAFVFKTGQSTITGTASQVNNGRSFAVQHGSAAGATSVWFSTTTRLYRIAESAITDGAANVLSDYMIEFPPGGSTTYTLTNSMNQIDYASTIDRIIVPTTTLRMGAYVGVYDPTLNTAFDKIFGANVNRSKLTTTDSDAANALFPQAAQTVWTEGGYLFSAPSVVTSGLNFLAVIPIGADTSYASTTNQRVITPKISTLNATKLYRTYLNHNDYQGSLELGLSTEPVVLYYRTSGIDDNSGSWTTVPENGDMTGASPGDYIQYMMEFQVMGESCIPAHLYSVACVYEDGSQDSHYQPSLAKSSAASGIIAWQQVLAWGTNIPDLQIRLYNASTGFLVLDDTVSSSSSGTWQYSTDGTNWLTWSSSADNVGNYIRYTATTLPNNITVRALLTQA